MFELVYVSMVIVGFRAWRAPLHHPPHGSTVGGALTRATLYDSTMMLIPNRGDPDPTHPLVPALTSLRPTETGDAILTFAITRHPCDDSPS
jgi:hypothetical protein